MLPAPDRSGLPDWLSIPVLVAAVPVLLAVVVSLVAAPVATLLPLPTFLMVLAVFVWFDRLEPEPWQQRVHAVLWGATVSVVVAGTVNTIVAVTAGEVAAVVVSAPIVEEVMKGAGVLLAVRRRQVDSVTDGVVYAGWVAAGFAVVENVQYFVMAAGEGALVATVLLRGVLSPFAHPLFTIWIGVTVGRAVVRGRSPVIGALPGLAVAILLHALWNGAAVMAQQAVIAPALVIALVFVVLFAVTATLLVRERLAGRHRLAQRLPQVGARYGLLPEEWVAFSDWRRTLAIRRSLSRDQRRAFDARHAAVARLAHLWDRAEPPDPATERRLVEQLWRVRSGGPAAG